MTTTTIILICFIVLLIIMYPIMMYSRNKKENLRMQEQTNSLKIGDKVLTTNGIYGSIVSIRDEFDRKVVTLESGDETNKGYVSIDAYAIYKIFEDETADTTQEGETENKADIDENARVDKQTVGDTDLEEAEVKEDNKESAESEENPNQDDTPKSEE